MIRKLILALTATVSLTMTVFAQNSYIAPNGLTIYASDYQQAVNNGSVRKMTTPEIITYAKNGVVKIYVQQNDNQWYQGTGFFINKDIVLTNYHMIRNVKNIIFQFYNGRRIQGGTIIASNKFCDVAAIRTSKSTTSWLWPVPDSSWERIGEKILVMGYPNDKSMTSEGVIKTCYLDLTQRDAFAFLTTAWGDHGQSGSPVFNEYGMVIGMIRGGSDINHQGVALAMNVLWEALGLTNADHPNGFITGVTNNVDIRDSSEQLADNTYNATNS